MAAFLPTVTRYTQVCMDDCSRTAFMNTIWYCHSLNVMEVTFLCGCTYEFFYVTLEACLAFARMCRATYFSENLYDDVRWTCYKASNISPRRAVNLMRWWVATTDPAPRNTVPAF